MAKHEEGSRRLKQLISVITLLALGLFIYVIRDQIVQTFEDIQRVNVLALLLMPLLQLVNYHSYTKMYQHVFNIIGEKLRYKKLFRIQLELNFVNNVFPSGGVSGISYFGLRFRNEGVGAGKATLVQVLKFVLVFISFQILLGVGLLLLAIGGQASNFLILITSSLVTFLLVGTFFMMYILGSKERINSFFTSLTRMFNKIIHFFRRSQPETISIVRVRGLFDELHDNYMLIKKNMRQLKKPLLFALLANTTEILTIYAVYMAFGQFVNPGAVIISYAIANFAGLISVLPGGVGVYEALMTATLAAAGIPPAVSLPIIVMYRILNTAIQLPPGYYFYHKSLHARQAGE